MEDSEYIITFTGRRFWPLNPRIEDLCLADIAHALARKCRWGGHTRVTYSVAQHSVHVSQLVAQPCKRWALLHDAAEAYLPDICRPIKQRYPELVAAEERILALVCRRWSLPPVMPPEVKYADDTMMVTEARDLMGFDVAADARTTGKPPVADSRLVCPWSDESAEHVFLRTAAALSIE